MTLERGIVTAKHDCKEVSVIHVRHFHNTVGNWFTFISDNVCLHWTSCIQDLLLRRIDKKDRSERINHMVLLTPDLNLFENAWEAHWNKQPLPHSTNDLSKILKQKWMNIPQKLLGTLELIAYPTDVNHALQSKMYTY